VKLVTAILRPEVLSKVRAGLCDVDIPGIHQNLIGMRG
jgi:nitrogen regulatory protein PII